VPFLDPAHGPLSPCNRSLCDVWLVVQMLDQS
jgi:hypothetical protein